MINSTDLKYFLETAKTLHVSRAAERLGITQPALSHCLKRIETEVRAELFIRTKQGVLLTSAGKILLEKAEQLNSQWSELLSNLKEDSQEVSGSLRLGCHISVAEFTLPEFVPTFLKSYSKVKLKLTHGLSRHMTEQVISSQLDVAIAVNPVPHPDLIIKEVLRDQVTLWRTNTCLNPEVLLIEPNLLQTQSLLSKLSRDGFHYERVIESSSLEVLARLMLAGTGHAILPEKVVKALGALTRPHAKIMKVKDAPVFEDRICLVYKREFIKSVTGKAFTDSVMKALAQKPSL